LPGFVSYFTLGVSLILKGTIKDLYKRLIMKAAAASVGAPWMWTLAFGHLADRTPTHGYAATRGHDDGIREKLAAGVGTKSVIEHTTSKIRSIWLG